MGHIFINHRRALSETDAEVLFLHLKTHFPEKRLFIDRRGLDNSADWKKRLKESVATTDVMIVVIGNGIVDAAPTNWLDITYPKSDPRADKPRLDDPEDLVRYEIVEAIDRGIPLVPVLVNGASMPPRDQRLPLDLWPLTKPQALLLRTKGGVKPEIDVAEIAKVIKVRLAERARPVALLKWVAAGVTAIALPIGMVGGLWAGDVFAPRGDVTDIRRQLDAERKRGTVLETRFTREASRAESLEAAARDHQSRLGQAISDRDRARTDLESARAKLEAAEKTAAAATARVAGLESDLAKVTAETRQMSALREQLGRAEVALQEAEARAKRAAAMVDLNTVRPSQRVVDMTGKVIAASLKPKGCPLDLLNGSIQDILERFYSSACFELDGAPNYKLSKVSIDTTTGLVTGTAEWDGTTDITALAVDAKIKYTGDRPDKNCGLQYSLVTEQGTVVFGPEPFVRTPQSDIFHLEPAAREKLKKAAVKLANVRVKIAPLPSAHCVLTKPEELYSISPGLAGVSKDGQVSISLALYSSGPEVTIVLANFNGFDTAGDTAAAFLETGLRHYRGIAKSINIKTFDSKGQMIDLGTEAGETVDPRNASLKYVSVLDVVQRNYSDEAEILVLKKIFDDAPGASPKHVIIFGLQSPTMEMCSGAKFKEVIVRRSEDRLSIIEFARDSESGPARRVRSALRTPGGFPAGDCRALSRSTSPIHWVVFPNDKRDYSDRSRSIVFRKFFSGDDFSNY